MSEATKKIRVSLAEGKAKQNSLITGYLSLSDFHFEFSEVYRPGFARRLSTINVPNE